MKGMVLICFNLLVILVQKQNPSTVLGKRTVDLALTLIKAKSLCKRSVQQIGQGFAAEGATSPARGNSDMQFSGLQKAAISSTEFSSSAATKSLVSPIPRWFYIIWFNLLVILVQKQSPSTVSGKRTVDSAHTLIEA